MNSRMEAEGFVVLPGVVPDVLMDNVVSDARSRLKDRGCVKRHGNSTSACRKVYQGADGGCR